MKEHIRGQSRWYLAGLALIGATLVVTFIAYEYKNIARDLKETQKELAGAKADVAKLIRHKFLKDSNVRSDALIVTLRDYVYKNTVIGTDQFDYGDAVDHFITLDLHENKMVCFGMAAMYSWLLRQFDIPSRTVVMAAKSFVDGDRLGDTHASVDVYDEVNQKWYASDPTFNVSFKCNGKGELLDYEELVSCLRKGGTITTVRNGVTYLKGRTVGEYYIPYSDLLFAIKAPEVSSSDGRVLIKGLELPHKDWFAQASKHYAKSRSVNSR